MIKTRIKDSKFGQAIYQIFDVCLVREYYKEDIKARKIVFTINDYDLNYDKLCRLSELLNTTDINIEGEYKYGYYYSVDQYYEIHVKGVKF